MKMSRRKAIQLLAGTGAAMCLPKAFGQGATPQIPSGPFAASRESLNTYLVPDWFRDAKFGIWAHWGSQDWPRAERTSTAALVVVGNGTGHRGSRSDMGLVSFSPDSGPGRTNDRHRRANFGVKSFPADRRIDDQE